nr:hypothetical protein [Tanacetum cinerariifolium]
SEESGSIIVVVDRFSKYEMFIAAPPDVTADDTSKLFFKNVVKYWGVPHVIVSDQDPRRANGEGERTIGALSLALWKSPFELVTGRQPLTPNALAASYEGSSPTAYKTTKEWHEQADMARESLDKATKRMKKWAEERRRHVEFESSRKVHKGLIRRYEGPFPVIGRVGKPYHGDEEDPERRVSKRAPTTVVTSYDREVEEILSDLKQVGKRKTYCGSLRTRSRDITRMAQRGRRELRWGRMSRPARFYEVSQDSGLFYT